MTPPNKPLVERLRIEADHVHKFYLPTASFESLAALLTEAADEIEALQHDMSRAQANHAADFSE